MMAVRVETGSKGAFAASMPEELFKAYLGNSRNRDYDPAPDGRFVCLRRAGNEGGSHEIRMLLSWRQQMQRTSRGGH